MRITLKENPKSVEDVKVGQVRYDSDGNGTYIIVTRGESKDKPFNGLILLEDTEDELYGALNWREGTDAVGIRDEFPIVVDAELILKGAK